MVLQYRQPDVEGKFLQKLVGIRESRCDIAVHYLEESRCDWIRLSTLEAQYLMLFGLWVHLNSLGERPSFEEGK